ncbi:carbohydrate ABC transporter permease [Rhodothermus marinus]|uniref:Binding-protein-dependent transport systems inner membrane component n=1 Tax=Rhodothermus marinus (strain ATCC 43812 / DSM 4252 / R-10) TaxID=518766 RepID=D0ME39_RHOM4|nr:sugar ABC transporter permease [Rhodothermus marinus]ACY47263.1 binding-protein-dependent transport systems inner membrane component [Rhodothermus marinus DSM 4252]
MPELRATLRRLQIRLRGERSGYVLVAPYLLHMAVFFGYPLLFAFVLMFHRWDIVTPMEFVGLKNFVRLVRDDLFFRALLNTGIFLTIHIPLQIIVALFFAELLNRPLRGRGFFRAAYFMPVVVSGVVITILFQQLFAFDTGLINRMIRALGGEPVPWLVSPALAMPSIALMATWKNVGLYIVLFLAGLQHIPKHLYEAAELDGANAWQRWWHVTLPMLNPTMVTVVVLSTIGGFSLFIEPYILTGGGPLNATLSAVLYIYNQAFYFNHMGYAAALGFCFAIVIFVVVLLQRRFVETDTWS